jgi:uncharacterized DUF497 family protein
MIEEYLPDFIGFDWDKGNLDKNRLKHHVEAHEAEQVFFNDPLVVISDQKHSVSEDRFAAFGKTNDGRKLAIVFTKRINLLRVISVRDMNKKERKFYNDYEKEENAGF